MTSFWEREISRRSFLRYSALVQSFMYGMPRSGQPVPRSSNKLKAKLVKQFRDAWLLAVSPDGRKLCLYFAKNPIDKFTVRGGVLTYEGGPSRKGDEALEAIEIGSWRALCSVQLRQRPSNASFFAESHLLHAETNMVPDLRNTWQHVVIDLQASKLSERLEKSDLHEPKSHYHALTDGVLLGEESVHDKFSRTVALTRVTLPDYREIARVPFSVKPILDGGVTGQIITSADRTLVVHLVNNYKVDEQLLPHGLNHSIVCRRAADLAVIWEKQIEPEYDMGPRFVTMTPDGSRVAAAVLDTSEIDLQRNFYIGIYDGNDGTTLARLRLNGREGIAMSPDGRVLAVGKTTSIRGEGLALTAELYEISSGQRLAVVEDDKYARFDLVHASGFGHRGLQFTPDGKHLITSISKHAKVWALDPPLAPAQS